MEKLNNLALNKKKMDTSMAQDYIKNYKEPEWLGKETCATNPDKVTKESQIEGYKLIITETNPLERICISKKLATKIEENAEMFAELEYLARGTDSRDVKYGHIKLMSQYLRCCNALWNSNYATHFIQVTEKMPLFHLASIADLLNGSNYFINNDVTISVKHQSMKHICRFFMQLCHEVGINIEKKEGFESDLSIPIPFASEKGCTGVVTEWSDLDSAVDAFIQSSKTAPWRLEQIYVQESVFEDFKNALLARATQTAERIVAGDKTFLFECLEKASGIPVDAYRTTKELLSLLRSPYLSLWAANSAVSNEVALNCAAHTVWVNDYACFDGPPRAALSVINTLCPSRDYKPDVDIETTLKVWSRMKALERLEVILSAEETSEDSNVRALLAALTVNWRSDELLHVTETSVCFGIQQQIGLIGCHILSIDNLFIVIKALVNGNAIVVNNTDVDTNFLKELFKRGVPIAVNKHNNSDTKKYNILYPLVMEKLKVIRTNHGTIFAN